MQLTESQQKLAAEIDQTLGKLKVMHLTELLRSQKPAATDLLALTFHPKKEVAFRAAWILENLFLTSPLNFIDDIDQLVTNFPLVKNESSLRHYIKILLQLTDKKAPKPIAQKIAQKIAQIDFEPIITRCFDFLIDEDSPIALKVFAMDLLANLRHREDWITEVLIGQIQLLMDGGGPAIRSRGKAVLKKIMR